MTQPQREEAIARMEQLIQAFALDPRLADDLQRGRIYRSYGDWGSIEPITADDYCWESCKRFARKTGAFVYHVIDEHSTSREINAPFGLLYVSRDPAEWPKEQLQDGQIQVCVCWYGDKRYTLEEVPLYADHGSLFLADAKWRRMNFEKRNVTVQIQEDLDPDADIVSDAPASLQRFAGEVITFLEGWGMFRDATLLIPGHIYYRSYPFWDTAPRHLSSDGDPAQWEEVFDLADPEIDLIESRPYFDDYFRRICFEDPGGLWLEMEQLRRAGRHPRPVLALYMEDDLREIVGNDDLDYGGDYEDDYEDPYVDAHLYWDGLSPQNQRLLLEEAWHYQGLPNTMSYRPDDLWAYLDGDTWEHYDPHRCSFDGAPNSTLDPLEFDSYDEYLDLEEPVLSEDPKTMMRDLADVLAASMRLGAESEVYGYNRIFQEQFFQFFEDRGLSYIVKGGRMLFFYADPQKAPDVSPETPA